MLGSKSRYADNCLAGNFIGVDFGIKENLAGKLPEEWRAFNARFIPVYMAGHPDKSKIAAGLSCGFVWTVAKGIQRGDVVLCPAGGGRYLVGEVVGDYQYTAGDVLPHRRPVRWFDQRIDRADMSQGLRNSTGSV